VRTIYLSSQYFFTAMPSKIEKRLREILGELPETQAVALLEYAEFLAARYSGPKEITAPLDIPRPEKESVVKAIKRLGATYPMIDRSKMLNETSVLMTQHVISGRDAAKVIDELEVLFRRHYEKVVKPEK
jgi:hypothetical protein